MGSWSGSDGNTRGPPTLTGGRRLPYRRDMNRRRFLLMALALAGIRPSGTEAQSTQPRPRIGWLTSSTLHAPNLGAFREGMQRLGYADFHLEVRAAEGRADRLSALVAELLALNVNVIVTDGGP